MASVDVIFVAIVVLGIIYMYINSRQYLVREGFKKFNRQKWEKQRCIATQNAAFCNLNCVFTNKSGQKECNRSSGDCKNHFYQCTTK
jgi:hypothetical protein